MSQTPKWVQALNIPEEKWNEWCHSSPEGESILFWCLTHEQISWSDYSKWAKNNLEICMLDDSYFQLEDTIGAELKSYMDPTLWRPWLQPLYSWDNVLYVACLEATEIKLQTKTIVPVICSPWQLESRWGKLKILTQAREPASDLPELPDGMIMTPDIGLSVKPSIPSNITPPAPPEPTVQTQLSIGKEDTQHLHLTNFNYEPQPQQASTETHDFGPISLTEAPADINSELKEREIISWLFNQIQPYFEMIWWVTLEEDRAVVKWWYPAKNFDPNKLKVDTHTPSFFRIVKKTKLPYHGHIVDSPCHQTFFSAFGDGNLPAHVTALPIVLQSQFKEILVGSSNQKQQDPKMLVAIEKILEKALQILDTQRKPTQKTA